MRLQRCQELYTTEQHKIDKTEYSTDELQAYAIYKPALDTYIMSLTNSFVATAGTNTREAAFKSVHSDLLNITHNVNNLDSHFGYHTVQCSKITIVCKDINKKISRQLGQLYCNWFCKYRKGTTSL